MSEVVVTIGQREFMVACQPGDEGSLVEAAQRLNAEAEPLIASLGWMPEARMLLMAGLVLADKTCVVENELRLLQEELVSIQKRNASDEIEKLSQQLSSQTEIFAQKEAQFREILGRLSHKVKELKFQAEEAVTNL